MKRRTLLLVPAALACGAMRSPHESRWILSVVGVDAEGNEIGAHHIDIRRAQELYDRFPEYVFVIRRALLEVRAKP